MAIAVLMAVPTVIFGQSERLPSAITVALEKGDAEQLSKFFNTTIDLTILEQNGVYSKQQGTTILANFFSENPVKKFGVIHEGNKDTASFAIGNLTTSKQTFRVYLLINTIDKQPIIQQLRIETND